MSCSLSDRKYQVAVKKLTLTFLSYKLFSLFVCECVWERGCWSFPTCQASSSWDSSSLRWMASSSWLFRYIMSFLLRTSSASTAVFLHREGNQNIITHSVEVTGKRVTTEPDNMSWKISHIRKHNVLEMRYRNEHIIINFCSALQQELLSLSTMSVQSESSIQTALGLKHHTLD